MVDITPLRCANTAARLIDWYWAVGSRRNGTEAIGTGSWLSTAYAAAKQSKKVAARPQGNRKTMALWGPSQAGKSTLLSRFLDAPSGEFSSALQWQPERSVMFVGADKRTGLRINPHNYSSDASGCVTRFSLTEKIPFEDFPVRFVFADPDQLLEAVAIGYITECEHETGLIAWDRDQISQLLDDLPGGGGLVERKSYELVHDFVLAVDDLLLSRWPRYLNLTDHWRQLRSAILESSALLGNFDAAKQFVAKILWDGNERLTEFYLYLLKHLKDFSKGNKTFYASYELTALVLDIAASEHVGASDIDGHFIHDAGDNVFLGAPKGKQIATNRLQFATFQALVWEIAVPVNEGLLRSSSPDVATALSDVDIVDFPGIAQQGQGGSKKRVAEFEQLELFTKILKRGKTASVVVSYARTLSIDGFSILVRMQNPIPHPDQLIAGLTAWCHELGVEWPPISNPPPLNIVLTFSAKLVNVVATIQTTNAIERLGTVFSWFESIRPIADTHWARFWTTSYPQFGDAGEGIIMVDRDAATAAIGSIMQNQEFTNRFAHDPQALERMALASLSPTDDGGVGYFISNIPSVLARSSLDQRRHAYVLETFDQLRSLAQVALPTDVSGSEAQKADIIAWQKDLLASLERSQRQSPETDAASTVASAVLAVTHVDPEDLAPLPQNAETRDIAPYLEEQIKVGWLEPARLRKSDLPIVGLDSPTEATRRLSYLAHAVAQDSGIADWVKSHLGHLTQPAQCKQARRFLALKLSDALLYGATRSSRMHRQHFASNGTESEVQTLLNQYASYEVSPGRQRVFSTSPHFTGLLKPFMDNLGGLAERPAKPRSPQPGDKEMAAIISAESL